jgi:O-antigen/teichoic acid export membrane protein
MSDIKKKVVSGVFWESIGRFSSLGIRFIVTIVIARILTPADYGVIGLLTVFTAISLILIDSGFSTALIRKTDATRTDLSSVFYFNLLIGVLVYGALYLASPYIAAFYEIPELTGYARLLFLIIPINSFGLIQNVVLQKRLQFRKSAVASVSASLLSGAIGIIMAYSGYGIMSLVVQQISMCLFNTLLYMLQVRWVPAPTFSIASIKGMFSFSVNLMLQSLINTVMKNIFTLIIGKYYSKTEVGYYNQASRFGDVSASAITPIVTKVSFPALAAVQDDVRKVKSQYKRLISMTCFIICPLTALMFVIAEPLFLLLLKERWLPAAPYFQLLCLYGSTLPIMHLSYNIYKLYKKGRLLVVLDSCLHVLIIAVIFLTIGYGVSAMLWGQFAAMAIMFFVNMHYSGKLISFSVKEQLRTVFPSYGLALLTGAAVWFTPPLVSGGFAAVAVPALLFISVFTALSAIFRLKAFAECIDIFKDIMRKIKH